MNSSPHIDNKGKDILILGKGPTQWLAVHWLTSEKMYSISFTVSNKKFCLNLHYNGANSYLFVNGTEIYKFKAKDSEIAARRPLCWGNISKDQQIIWKKWGLVDMCMILVLVKVLLRLMILKIFISIWWRKMIWYDYVYHAKNYS